VKLQKETTAAKKKESSSSEESSEDEKEKPKPAEKKVAAPSKPAEKKVTALFDFFTITYLLTRVLRPLLHNRILLHHHLVTDSS